MTPTLRTLYAAYSKRREFIEEPSPNSKTFAFRHQNADPKDLARNLAVAKTLNQNGFSVIIREHLANQGKQPELEIIYENGRRFLSDLKTPNPNQYKSIRSSIKNQFASASNQKIKHLVIDVSNLKETDYDIAVGVEEGFKHNKEIERVIVVRNDKAVEITRQQYLKRVVKKEIKRGL